MKLQKAFIVVSSKNSKKMFHRLIVTDKGVFDQVNTDTFFDILFEAKNCTPITQSDYDEIIIRLCSIIYGKFADPETPIYDLVNSFKYIHNIFLNEPCED